jgi:hypothetical protein
MFCHAQNRVGARRNDLLSSSIFDPGVGGQEFQAGFLGEHTTKHRSSSMAQDTVIAVNDRNTNDARIIGFQRELVNRYLPEGIAFHHFDMESVMAELQEPP